VIKKLTLTAFDQIAEKICANSNLAYLPREFLPLWGTLKLSGQLFPRHFSQDFVNWSLQEQSGADC